MGGFIKVCMSTRSIEEHIKMWNLHTPWCGRRTFDGGVLSFKQKVQKLRHEKIILLGIMAHTQENYDNVAMLLSLLQINNFFSTIATT